METSKPDLDTELMLRIQEGDQQSFERLTELHRGTLLGHVSRRIRNPAVAEELVQDVFLRVYRARDRWKPSAKFRTWLFRISVNVILNHFRDDRWDSANLRLDDRPAEEPALDFPDRGNNAEQELLLRSARSQVRAAVEALPEKQRKAVLMHKCDDLDYCQIADELGCTHAAIKSIMFRAHEALRKQLAHLAYGERA